MTCSGADYPQGNSLNEAVHKGIESSLAVRRQYNTFFHYSDILRDTTLAYNSTPYSSLGVSPYFTLFGKYMSLPRLQRFQERTSEEKRIATIYDIRKQAMQRAVMEADSRLRLYEPKSLTVGDDVVYHLQQHEKKTEASNEGKELLKYSPSWSTLVKIVSLQQVIATVDQEMGRTAIFPRRLLRKLCADVPSSLQPLLLSSLDKCPARLRERPDYEMDNKTKKKRKLEVDNSTK